MPIYEFYCRDCHRIFSFLSRSVDTRKRPRCPKCGQVRLERRPSAFAVSRGLAEPSESEADLPDVDEARVERAMAGLADEAERLDEKDPRAMARLMHKFYETTGLPMGDGTQEALRRLEAGEDPDEVSDELGDLLDAEDPFAADAVRRPSQAARRLRPPSVDKTLYEL